MTIYDKIKEYSEEEYKEFQSKLVPNVDKNTIIGIRTPIMRKIAKELYNTDEGNEFLNSLPHEYYEENLIHFFMISRIKDFDECIRQTEKFLPYVNCWPVSDQASPTTFKKHHNKLLPYIKKWIESEHTYTARFGIRMLMNEFLNDDFKKEYLMLVASKEGDDYYLKMMIAWYFATALAKQYDETLLIIKSDILDTWTQKKAIQKALESYRVSDEHKKELKQIRQNMT